MSWPRTAAVIVVALMLQVSLLARFSYDGARPDLMVLVAIAAGFVAGSERGALVGFAAGLSFDVLLATPLGLSALVYTLVGYVVGTVSGGILRTSWWIGPATVATASAAAMALYALVGRVFGLATFDGPPLSAILVVVSVVNALLAPLAIRALRWAAGGDPERPRSAFAPR